MKYIIEIPDDVQYVLLNGKADNKYYTAVHPIAELEELNSDYINEHFGSLQDEAYQKGINDGSLDVKQRVEGAYQKGFEDGKKSVSDPDRIEVGDEVIDKDGDTTIVTNIHERLFDGLCSDGSTMSDLFLEDVRKTGRHYDHICKLLEAIRA